MHIRRFEVFEKFLSPEPAWPLEMDKVLRCSAALSHKPGFTLIDSFVGTCSWILRRFLLPPLPLPNPMLSRPRALDRQGVETREVTEAIGVPLKLAKLLEKRMLLDESQQPVFALVTFQILTLMWASIRFDDGLHIAPSSSSLKVLFFGPGRPRRSASGGGTKCVIGRISFTQDYWVLRGYNIFMNSTPLEYRQEDFYLFQVVDGKADFRLPQTYQRFVHLLRWICDRAVRLSTLKAQAQDELIGIIPSLTGHSLRVTMPNQMGHAGVDPGASAKAIGPTRL